jgi:hypothetical protein
MRCGGSQTAQALIRTKRAFGLYCQRLPPRLAIVVLNELIADRLDRLDSTTKRPRGKVRRRRPESPADGGHRP